MGKIYFAKLKEGAIIPTREVYNAGLDIYPCFEEDYLIIPPNETKLIPTGIASAIPLNFYIQIHERGSTGSKGIKYSAGVIDSSYRGEWFLATTNTNNKPLLITKIEIDKLDDSLKSIIKEGFIVYPYEKAIAQCMMVEVPKMAIEEISYEDLLKIESERGTGALGSSGK